MRAVAYSNLISSTLEVELARCWASDEQDCAEMSWPSVPLKAEKGMLVFFQSGPAMKVCLRGDAAAAGGEDQDAVGLAVAFGEERDAFLRRQIHRNEWLRTGRPHHAGPGVGQAAVDQGRRCRARACLRWRRRRRLSFLRWIFRRRCCRWRASHAVPNLAFGVPSSKSLIRPMSDAEDADACALSRPHPVRLFDETRDSWHDHLPRPASRRRRCRGWR